MQPGKLVETHPQMHRSRHLAIQTLSEDPVLRILVNWMILKPPTMILIELTQDPDSLNQVIQGMQAQNDSLFQVVNSLTTQKQEFELINQVNDYFDSAFNKLLAMIGFIGVIVPLLYYFFQKELFRLKKDEIVESVRKNTIDTIRKKVGKEVKTTQKDVDESINELYAKSHFTDSILYSVMEDPCSSFVSSLFSVKRYMKTRQFTNAQRGLKNCIKDLDQIKAKDQFRNNQKLDRKPVDKLISDIKNDENYEAIDDLIATIETWWNDLPDATEDQTPADNQAF